MAVPRSKSSESLIHYAPRFCAEWARASDRERPAEESDHGERGIVKEAGCGDCGEEFAEASVLPGLAGGEAGPGGGAGLWRAGLTGCGGCSPTPSGVCGAGR